MEPPDNDMIVTLVGMGNKLNKYGPSFLFFNSGGVDPFFAIKLLFFALPCFSPVVNLTMINRA